MLFGNEDIFIVYQLFAQVPLYICAQVFGSICGSLAVCVLNYLGKEHFFGTISACSNVQSFVIEFALSFFLMFVIRGVTTGYRIILSCGFLLVILPRIP